MSLSRRQPVVIATNYRYHRQCIRCVSSFCDKYIVCYEISDIFNVLHSAKIIILEDNFIKYNLGYNLMKNIRRKEPHLKIIFLISSKSLVKSCPKNANTFYFQKPIINKKFSAIIRQITTKKHTHSTQKQTLLIKKHSKPSLCANFQSFVLDDFKNFPMSQSMKWSR